MKDGARENWTEKEGCFPLILFKWLTIQVRNIFTAFACWHFSLILWSTKVLFGKNNMVSSLYTHAHVSDDYSSYNVQAIDFHVVVIFSLPK